MDINNKLELNKFSVMVLPEYIYKILNELNINLVELKDSIKMFENISDSSEDTSGYNELKSKITKFLGKGDVGEIAYLNKYLHNYLNVEMYENNFSTYYEEILWESNKNEETTVCLILNTLLSNNINEMKFQDTYKVVNINGVILVLIKTGFTNFITGINSVQTKKTLLKDIIESNNDEAMVRNSLGVSYIKLAYI